MASPSPQRPDPASLATSARPPSRRPPSGRASWLPSDPLSTQAHAGCGILVAMETLDKPRCFHLTPSWLIVGLLVVEGLLFLSDWYRWPTWHKGYAVVIAVAAVGVAFILMLLWLIVALVFRLRFQFGIRSLLIFTLVVALPFSWLAVEVKAAREQKAAVDEIARLDGRMSYDWEVDANLKFVSNAEPPGPEWLRNLLGVDFFAHVLCVNLNLSEVTDADLPHLEALNQLRVLLLIGTKVTDDGVNKLSRALPKCRIIGGEIRP